jgi:hypothetical protein
VQSHAVALKRVPALSHNLRKSGIERIAESHVSNHASLKEGKRPYALGAVDDLIWNHEIARPDLFLQAPYSAESDDGPHTYRTKSSNVGLILDFVRRELVVQAMA